MHVCAGMNRQTLLKKDISIAWKCAYELRQDMDMIKAFKGSWEDAAMHGRS
jgi:hypothetical protein